MAVALGQLMPGVDRAVWIVLLCAFTTGVNWFGVRSTATVSSGSVVVQVLVMGALILQAILSWVNPYSPIAPILNSVTRPFLRPFQRVIPLVANVDLSPLAALLVCQLILAVPLTWLEANLGRLL